MSDFPIDFAYLIGSWVAAVLWGIYDVLFGWCMVAVFRNNQLHKVQLGLLVALWVIATCHISLDLRRLVEGFVDTSEADRILFFSNVALNINVAKDFLYITSLILGDSIIVWRCWIVWNRNTWVVVFPVIMVTGEAIAGYGAISKYLSPDLTTDSSVKPWATGMFSVSLATNVMVTGLTAGRIWWISRLTTKFVNNKGRSFAALALIVESGAAITVAKIIEFTLFQIAFAGTVNMQAIYILFEAMPQLTGIIPTLIILSIQTGMTSSSHYVSGAPHTGTVRSRPFGRSTNGQISAEYGTHGKGPNFPVISVETATFGEHSSDIELATKRGGLDQLPRKTSTDSSLA